MRSIRWIILFALLIALDGRATTVFIPVISAPAQPIESETSPLRDVRWLGTHTVSNPTDVPLTFRYVRILGGPLAKISEGCRGGLLTVPPHFSWPISSLGSPDCAIPGNTPAFVELDLDPQLIVTASVHLMSFLGCGVAEPLATPLATAPLPAYPELFAAGSTAAAAGIPATGELNPGYCPSSQHFPTDRRLNLTVVNAGTQAATFAVTALGAALPAIVVTVAPGEVAQVNRFFDGPPFEVLLVTSTQPFLCYASSVTTWADPARIPALAVYPFRVIP